MQTQLSRAREQTEYVNKIKLKTHENLQNDSQIMVSSNRGLKEDLLIWKLSGVWVNLYSLRSRDLEHDLLGGCC